MYVYICERKRRRHNIYGLMDSVVSLEETEQGPLGKDLLQSYNEMMPEEGFRSTLGDAQAQCGQ